jgi:hypothetical protein
MTGTPVFINMTESEKERGVERYIPLHNTEILKICFL